MESETFATGDAGEDYVISILKSRYGKENVWQVPKEINVQLENADIVIRPFPELGIPRKVIEVKTEKRHTGNLFWEWWSNKGTGREGWGRTTPADEMFYLFTDVGIGYRLTDVQGLMFLIDYHKIEWELKNQKKYDQENDTWGYCIPVKWFNECAGRLTKFELKASD